MFFEGRDIAKSCPIQQSDGFALSVGGCTGVQNKTHPRTSRFCVLGAAHPQMKEIFDFATRRQHTTLKRCPNPMRNTKIRRDFNAELGPGLGVERLTEGPYTLNESNKRGDRLKQWLMILNFSALNTMFKKRPDKQTTFCTSRGEDKQLDYILVGDQQTQR